MSYASRSRHLLSVATLLIASQAWSQAPTSADLPGHALPTTFARLRENTRIRLHLSDDGRIERTYLGLTDTTIVIGAPVTTLRLTRIDSVWIRARSTGKGAWVGAIVGGLLTGATLAALESSVCSGEACDVGTYFGYGTLGGGVGGALIGAAVGSAIPRWKRRFP